MSIEKIEIFEFFLFALEIKNLYNLFLLLFFFMSKYEGDLENFENNEQ